MIFAIRMVVRFGLSLQGGQAQFSPLHSLLVLPFSRNRARPLVQSPAPLRRTGSRAALAKSIDQLFHRKRAAAGRIDDQQVRADRSGRCGERGQCSRVAGGHRSHSGQSVRQARRPPPARRSAARRPSPHRQVVRPIRRSSPISRPAPAAGSANDARANSLSNRSICVSLVSGNADDQSQRVGCREASIAPLCRFCVVVRPIRAVQFFAAATGREPPA